MPDLKPSRPIQVLSVGLGRTGSYSMAVALRTLGYRDVFHLVDAMDSLSVWPIISRAADASFPNLPSYTGTPFTREQWDEAFAPCEAITDIAGPFALPLIETYPEAKVILVTRDFDKWFRSVDETLLPTMWGPVAEVFRLVFEPLVGSIMIETGRKTMLGWAGVEAGGGVEGFRAKAREAFERHERDVVAAVPPERLLRYRMGDGWEPLCSFLGKEVPDEEFPRANEGAVLRAKFLAKQVRIVKEAGRRGAPILALAVILVACGFWLSPSAGV